MKRGQERDTQPLVVQRLACVGGEGEGEGIMLGVGREEAFVQVVLAEEAVRPTINVR